jgi:phospholipid N-methyltransferase
MDRLDDEDIGLIWARHYPKRTESQSSKSLCITLAMIVKQRAESIILPYDDGTDKLERALLAARVPREQFDSVEAETKFDK